MGKPTGRFLLCPGSGRMHGKVILEIVRGRKLEHVRCPVQKCLMEMSLPPGLQAGMTFAEARAASPDPEKLRPRTAEEVREEFPDATIIEADDDPMTVEEIEAERRMVREDYEGEPE